MKSQSLWYLYIIRTKSGKLYTGITTDINRRLNQHKNKKGAKYFRKEIPEEVIYSERHINRSEATKRELEIKKLSKINKLKLIKYKTSALCRKGAPLATPRGQGKLGHTFLL